MRDSVDVTKYKESPDPRHNARRLALAILFGKESRQENNWQELEKYATDILELNGKVDHRKVQEIVEGVRDNHKLIDSIIVTNAPEWPLEQINRVDLICLRIAIYELLIAQNVPHKVVINEAVEIAKEFGGDTSGKFVNGVLGTVVQVMMPEKI